MNTTVVALFTTTTTTTTIIEPDTPRHVTMKLRHPTRPVVDNDREKEQGDYGGGVGVCVKSEDVSRKGLSRVLKYKPVCMAGSVCYLEYS